MTSSLDVTRWKRNSKMSWRRNQRTLTRFRTQSNRDESHQIETWNDFFPYVKKTTRLSSSETLMKIRTWTILCLRLTWYRSKISIRGSGSHANQFLVKTPDHTTPYIYQLIVIITQVCLHVSIEESVRDKSIRNTRSPLGSDSTLSEMTYVTDDMSVDQDDNDFYVHDNWT